MKKSWASPTTGLTGWRRHKEEGAAAGLTLLGGPRSLQPRQPGWGLGWGWGWRRGRQLRGAAAAAPAGGGQAAASCPAWSPAPGRPSVQRVRLGAAPSSAPAPNLLIFSTVLAAGCELLTNQSPVPSGGAARAANREATGAVLEGQVSGGGRWGLPVRSSQSCGGKSVVKN